MKLSVGGFFLARPHDTWLNGVKEAAVELGVDHHFFDIKFKDNKLVCPVPEPSDVLLLLLNGQPLREPGLRALGETTKKIVIWYPDAYDYFDGDPKADEHDRWLDSFYITETRSLAYYAKAMPSVNVQFLPHGAIERSYRSSTYFAHDISFLGTRWSIDPGLNDVRIWDRTKLLILLNLEHRIHFVPEHGFHDHKTAEETAGLYRSSRINLSVNRYPGIPHGQSQRVWDILGSGGLLLSREEPGIYSDHLFRHGEILTFQGIEGYARMVKNILKFPNGAEGIRQAGWHGVQERGLARHRLKKILEQNT